MGKERGQRAVWGCLVVACIATGCVVHTTSHNNSGDDVSIHTPFGGMHVDSGNGHAVDTGLPVYPGAQLEPKKKDDDGSVDLHMGFGPWQLRVQVASYVTPEPEGKVQAFYTKSLAQYGAVLTCRGHEAVGDVKRTASGLTCADDDSKEQVHVHEGDLELKAGSKQHQHIVGFEHDKGPGTHFALIALLLPNGHEESGQPE